jgi:3-hydroxymyristoyl/3-hydroxydecanoyl-(acyl carrier protein) dehydratase
MYSDSRLVVDALAGLIEAVVERHQAPTVSEERMTQVRYIMQVDEASFRSNISPIQLLSIESKEMASILEELVSAIGLQRFRFVDRQTNGMCCVACS